MNFLSELTRGIIKENPTFRLVLGMCPTLALTTSLENALGMGAACIFVLMCSNAAISFLRNVIPSAVRIPCYIVIIASFTQVVDLLIQAFSPSLAESLGIFIPLITVNCIILGRAEAYASKNSVLYSIADGAGSGIGFLFSLAIIATIREFLGNGSITIWGDLAFQNLHNCSSVLVILPAGGFVTLGLVLALMNHLQAKAALRKGEAAPPPLDFDCRHCALCKIGE